MWIKEVLLAVVGAASGATASAGLFAFLTSIGVLTRIIGKTHTAWTVNLYETIVIIGATLASVFTVFQLTLPTGGWILVPYGIGAGIYIGCLGMALAEIINVFPILFRRLNIKHGLNFIFPFEAAGKFLGAMFFFAMAMWSN